MRQNAVKHALKSGPPSVGTWLSLGSITAARFMARAGFNWLTTDIEHSHVDWETATHMFAAMRYPPVGNRSVGGSVHALNFGTNANDYYAHANEELLVVLQCEHITAVENADAIFSVPGIDAIFVGPNDLAQSMRSKDNKPPSAQATKEAMDHILKTCKKYGVAPGLHTGSADEANARIAEGWQFIAITSESKMMLNGAAQEVNKLPTAPKKGEMAKY